jgi:hypothetical protein
VARRKLYRLALAAASVLAALLAAEAGLRILDTPKPPLSGWRSFGTGALEKNQLGFRGRPVEYADEDFVVVLLGDSQVEAVACAYEWMPERRLQLHLNAAGKRVRVFSVGAGGYGQDQQLLALRGYLSKFRADLVVLWQTPVNDIWNNVFPSYLPEDGPPKPTFWLEGGQLRGPTEGLGQPVGDAPRLKLALAWRRLFGWSRDRRWEKLYPPAYRPESAAAGAVKDDWQRWWDDDVRHMRGENLDNEKSHLSIFLTPRSERMQYGLDLTRKLMQEIERLTHSHGGRFTTFTTEPPLASEPGSYEGVHVLHGKYYRTSEAQYRSNLEYLNGGFDFFFVPVTVEQWRVGPENPHLNEHANDQVMRDLASRLAALVPAAR